MELNCWLVESEEDDPLMMSVHDGLMAWCLIWSHAFGVSRFAFAVRSPRLQSAFACLMTLLNFKVVRSTSCILRYVFVEH